MANPTSRNLYATNQTTLLRAVADTGLNEIGHSIGHDKSYVSRFMHCQQKFSIDELLHMLAACGLRFARDSGDDVQIPCEEYRALLLFARKAVTNDFNTGRSCNDQREESQTHCSGDWQGHQQGEETQAGAFMVVGHQRGAE